MIDRTHVGAPHQVDLWRIRSGTPLGTGDLDELVGHVVEAVLPGARWRSTAAVHPYTTSGRQVDVWTDGGWVELPSAGWPPRAYSPRRGSIPVAGRGSRSAWGWTAR